MYEYKVWNDAMATTAALRKVATGTAVRTMLQLATPATRMIQILAWGFTLDVAQAGRVELIDGDVAATVLTAHVASGIQAVDGNTPAGVQPLTLGTAATGYMVSGGSAPTENTITASRTLAQKEVTATAGFLLDYEYQFMPWEIPTVTISRFVRVRATFGTTTNMQCWITFRG